MNYYIDIKVLPDPEFEASTLMNALFAKCHRILGQIGDGEVGVSFPSHGKTLGTTLRLHGSQAKLKALMTESWLKGLRDYTDISGVLEVPDSASYRTVARIHTKSSHNKRKRSVSKGWLTAEEAAEKITDDDKHRLELPFARLTSLSNKNPYQVFIRHGELSDQPTQGSFSSFGLSKTATIPWF
ncbi:MAG: type I-F CRISPR-associated endoribonuclease Cas6/Csy4 [Arenicella sp.]